MKLSLNTLIHRAERELEHLLPTAHPTSPKAAARPTSTASAGDHFQAGNARGAAWTPPNTAPRLSSHDLGVIPQQQGNTNACGTTSLASVLSYFGMNTTHQTIDQSIRPFNLGTPIDRLASYANSHGLRASVKNGASLEDLAHNIDQGAPTIALIDPDSQSNFNTHYVVVSGYERDAKGQVSKVVLSDPAGGRRVMDAAAFEAQWSNIHLKGVRTGENREMLTMVPSDNRVLVGADGVARRANDLKLPTSNLKNQLLTTPLNTIEDVGSELASDAQSLWQSAKHAWNKLKHLF